MIMSISDFSGGITDYPHSQDSKYASECDNFSIQIDRSLGLRRGIDLYSVNNPRCSNNMRIRNIIAKRAFLFLESASKLYSIDSSGFTEIQTSAGSDMFYQHDELDYCDHDSSNEFTIFTSMKRAFRPIKVYAGSGAYEGVTAGLPGLPTTPVVTPDANNSKNYIYYFVLFREFYVNGKLFQDFGPVTTVTSTNSSDFSGSGHYNQISNLPTIANSLGFSYKVGTEDDDIKIRVYRTTHNGSVPYYVGQVDNGTSTYEDTSTDTSIQSNAVLYISGGEADNDEPPLCKYFTVVKNTGWYANTSEGDNILRQSKPGDVDSCPESFFIELEDSITGLSNTRDFPIVFTIDRCFRIEGIIDSFGRGDLFATSISDKVGCIAPHAIVRVSNGIYFPAEDGWYFTDGYQVTPISTQIDKRYAELTSNQDKINRIRAAYSLEEARLYVAYMSEDDNDIIHVFDEDFGAWTTITAQSEFTPTALVSDSGNIVFGDDEGYLFVFSEASNSDVKRSTGVAVSSWERHAIIPTYKHIHFDFGMSDGKKWVSKVSFKMIDETGQHLAISGYNNLSITEHSLKPIETNYFPRWGDAGVAWGTAGIRFVRDRLVVKSRRFPRNNLRCLTKQLKLTSSTATIQYSDLYGTATVDDIAKTITLGTATSKWAENITGAVIRLDTSDNGYSDELVIASRDSDTQITVTDTGNVLNSGAGAKWEILGYKLGDVPEIKAISYYFEPFASPTNNYQSSEAEGNS